MPQSPIHSKLKSQKHRPASIIKLHETQASMLNINSNLTAIVDNLFTQRSIFTRAAYLWSDAPVWLKVVFGVILFGTLLGVGITIQWPMLIIVACLGSLTYLGIGLLLNDHTQVENKSRDELKTSLSALGTILTDVIGALDQICTQLAVEIEAFKLEINHLHQTIVSLTTQIDRLSVQIEHVSMTAEELSVVNTDLKNTKEILNIKINELTLLTAQLNAKIDDLNQSNTTFKSTLTILATQLQGNEQSQQAFMQQFTQLFTEHSGDMTQILNRLYQSETELTQVKEQLERANGVYEQLLTRHEKLLMKDQKLQNKLSAFLDKKAQPKWVLQDLSSARLFRLPHKKPKDNSSQGDLTNGYHV